MEADQVQLGVANQRVRRLVELHAKDIIEQFEQESDVPMRHHEALGVLEALGAFDSADPVALVGAWWARILHKDVMYLLLEGLECIAKSRPSVNKLAASSLLDSDPLALYVVARWHDAAGRIQFRCGDMMAARLEFTRAAQFARSDEMWFCRSDIQSNLRRAEFDEQEKVGEDRKLRVEYEAFQALYDETLQLATAHAIDVTSFEPVFGAELRAFIEGASGDLDGARDHLISVLPACDARDRLHACELLRGLANVLHNLSIVSTPQPRRSWDGDPEASRRLAWRSAVLAFGLGDGYRLAQALRQIVSIAPAGDRFAARCLEIMRRQLPWERGKWMATQLLASRVEPAEARLMLEGVLDKLRERQAARGADVGFDVDVHRYTVEALAKVTSDEQQIRKLKLESARNIRRVVKVSTYRQRLAEVLYPAYLREIEHSCRAGSSGEAAVDLAETTLAFVEEASARELMDLLAATHRADDAHAPGPAGSPKPAADAPVVSAEGKVRGDLLRHGAFTDVYEAIGRSRDRFEQHALQHPVLSAPHDTEVAGELRRLTATQLGLVIVRYFVSGFEAGRPRELCAMVFRNGDVKLLVGCLEFEAMQSLAAEPHAEGPTFDRARRIWDVLVAPLWDQIIASGLPEVLVMIPAAGMFSLPLHVALPHGDEEVPLGIRVPFCMSVSATAYVSRRRHLLQTQPVDRHDDLCALVPGEAGVYPGELANVRWPSVEHFHLAGARPQELAPDRFTWWGAGNRAGLACLLAQRAEFFVYAGHGVSINRGDAVEVALQLANGDYLTQYDLVTEVALRRNKCTLIDACVSGAGGDTASGEVAGFLRAFIAAGAGALAVTQWKVRDAAIGRVAGRLLQEIAHKSGQCIDIVRQLRYIQYGAFLDAKLEDNRARREVQARDVQARDVAGRVTADNTQVEAGLHACPLVLYL